jgi:NADH:ubiquinone oxidoreductase subunit 6 (subunit J)
MNEALIGGSFPTVVVYAGSLIVVMWAVFDMARRPASELPSRRKAAWVIGTTASWLLFGLVGAFVAIVYLVGPRRRMDAQLR